MDKEKRYKVIVLLRGDVFSDGLEISASKFQAATKKKQAQIMRTVQKRART